MLRRSAEKPLKGRVPSTMAPRGMLPKRAKQPPVFSRRTLNVLKKLGIQKKHALKKGLPGMKKNILAIAKTIKLTGNERRVLQSVFAGQNTHQTAGNMRRSEPWIRTLLNRAVKKVWNKAIEKLSAQERNQLADEMLKGKPLPENIAKKMGFL